MSDYFVSALETLKQQEHRLREGARILDQASSDEAWMLKPNGMADRIKEELSVSPDNGRHWTLAEYRNAVQIKLDDIRDAINTLLGVRAARDGYPLAPDYPLRNPEYDTDPMGIFAGYGDHDKVNEKSELHKEKI